MASTADFVPLSDVLHTAPEFLQLLNFFPSHELQHRHVVNGAVWRLSHVGMIPWAN